jgi:hypothetical protein
MFGHTCQGKASYYDKALEDNAFKDNARKGDICIIG